MLEIGNLSIGYPNQSPIVRNVNLKLNVGNLVCLLGKNGIGKSTFLRAITTGKHKLSGSVLLDGKPVVSYKVTELSEKISLVLTEKIPENDLTVFEIVALGRQPYTNWIGEITKNDQKIIHKSTQFVGVQSLLGKKFQCLSDGQQQKVMIARALAQDTDVIVLDEPTANLDFHHTIEVFKLLKQLCVERQKTVIVATHQVNVALKLANQLWLLNEGVFKAGATEKMLSDTQLHNLYPKNQVFYNEKINQFVVVDY